MVKASEITKRRRKPSAQIPHGAGYVTESHAYGPPDIYTTVKYSVRPDPVVTAYFINYQSFIEHRLNQPPHEQVGRWRYQELSFPLFAKVDGEYNRIMTITATNDETLDELVDGVIVKMNGLTDTEGPCNFLPRGEGFSFDLRYKGSSLFEEINMNNRRFGQRVSLKEYFRGEPRNEYELVWKEYDAQGRELGNSFSGNRICPIIDLTDEPSDEDEEVEDGGEEAETEMPSRVLRRPAFGSNLIVLLSSPPASEETFED